MTPSIIREALRLVSTGRRQGPLPLTVCGAHRAAASASRQTMTECPPPTADCTGCGNEIDDRPCRRLAAECHLAFHAGAITPNGDVEFELRASSDRKLAVQNVPVSQLRCRYIVAAVAHWLHSQSVLIRDHVRKCRCL